MNHQRGNQRQHQSPPALDTHQIRFDIINADLFNKVAQGTAKTIAKNGSSNKPTQLRRFYDEIVMWENKVSTYPDRFEEYLPFIRMLNAKTAYAHGRNNKKGEKHLGLVDQNYLDLLHHCLSLVRTPETMSTFKTFMEAFMGFYKVERPKD